MCILFKLVIQLELYNLFFNDFMGTKVLGTNPIIFGFLKSLFVFQPLSLFIVTGLPLLVLAFFSIFRLPKYRLLSLHTHNCYNYLHSPKSG